MTNETGLGQILLKQGLIDVSGLALAKDAQRKHGGSLSCAVLALGLAEEQSLVAAIAGSLGLESLGPEAAEVQPEAAGLLTSEFCRRRLVAPLAAGKKTVRMAVTDPMDYETIQDVEFRTGKRVVTVVASERSVVELLDRLYPKEDLPLNSLAADEIHGELETVGDEIEVVDPAKLAKDTQMPPVIRLVNLILSGAAKAGASDIHMEPKDTHLQIRYRVVACSGKL